MTTLDLRCGDYRETLADVTCDVMCADPPYSDTTHDGHGRHLPAGCRDLDYQHWTPDDVREYVAWSVERTRWWSIAMTDDELAPVYKAAFRSHGWVAFRSTPWISKRVRHVADGPPSWVCEIIVARPRDEGATFAESRYLNRWHHLKGAYLHTRDADMGIGGKPVDLLTDILTDYTKHIPGAVICDPTSGERPTTALACRRLGLPFVGAERVSEKWAKASARLGLIDTSHELPLFGGGA